MDSRDRPLLVQEISPADLAPVWSRCSQLAARMCLPSVFCGGEWLAACAAHGPAPERLRVFTVVERQAPGTIVGVLPLVLWDNALGGRDLHFLGAEFHPDPLGLICAADRLGECVAAMRQHLEHREDWDRLILEHCGEPDARAWGAPAAVSSVAPYIALPPDFEDLLAGFSRKKRQTLRAKVKRLEQRGAEFVVADRPDLREELFAALWSLHARRADQKEIVSTFRGAHVESLHRDLLGRSESVRLFGLRLEGRIIAVIYGFEFAGSFFYYQVAHHPGWASLSPGLALIFLTCREACYRGLWEYNFLQGAEEYKTRWTRRSRPLHRVIWSRGNWRSRVLESSLATRRGAARLLKGIR